MAKSRQNEIETTNEKKNPRVSWCSMPVYATQTRNIFMIDAICIHFDISCLCNDNKWESVGKVNERIAIKSEYRLQQVASKKLRQTNFVEERVCTSTRAALFAFGRRCLPTPAFRNIIFVFFYVRRALWHEYMNENRSQKTIRACWWCRWNRTGKSNQNNRQHTELKMKQKKAWRGRIENDKFHLKMLAILCMRLRFTNAWCLPAQIRFWFVRSDNLCTCSIISMMPGYLEPLKFRFAK